MIEPSMSFQASLAGGTTAPQPLIDVYEPTVARNGRGMIIFPGGGYRILCDYEGAGYAEFYCAHGYTSFVVSYRLGTEGHRHPAMVEDAAAAVSTVRARAEEFGVRADALAAIGSSAGGHLVALLCTQYVQHAWGAGARPDAMILCYPVISMATYALPDCVEALLGDAPTREQIEAVSCELHTHKEMPPAFVWHTGDDQIVPVHHSLMFAQALSACGVPYELHVYAHGRHGLGLQAPYPWAQESLRWLDGIMKNEGECGAPAGNVSDVGRREISG